MNQRLMLPEDGVTQLKCGWCKGVLSVPPIYLSKGGKFTCGRCKSGGIRLTIYEELAKWMIFPCVYEECTAKLPWGKTKLHELHCPHKTTLCPVYNCPKTYELRRILAHFEKSHKQYILPNPAKATKNLEDSSVKHFRSDNKVFLTMHEKTAFLIFVDSTCVFGNLNKNRITAYDYSFGVFSTSEAAAGNFKYEITLDHISDKGTVTQFKKDLNVEAFDENVHCHDCLNGSCPLKQHKKSKDFLTAKFPNLQRCNHMRLTYTVHIYGNVAPQSVPSTDGSKNGDITSKLECPICKDYMYAPIYNCAKGHTLCGDCKRQVRECPFCKAEIGKSRNFILEDIAESLKIPCTNADNGCKFVGYVRSTKEHEKYCSFNPAT